MLRKWEDLPEFMKCEEVRKYYDILKRKKVQLRIKRTCDVLGAGVLLVLLAVPMVLIAAAIKADSPGPVFFRQERITVYGRKFRIHKFRTMISDAAQKGPEVTVRNDGRITRVGSRLRELRLDELPQLLDILAGNMSFVGTRPEAVKYVKKYTKEMRATLLLPAGITSEASIRYRDEAGLLEQAEDVDEIYLKKILPKKMKYNLTEIRNFSIWEDLCILVKTALAVWR